MWFITFSTWGPAVLVQLVSTQYMYCVGVKVMSLQQCHHDNEVCLMCTWWIKWLCLSFHTRQLELFGHSSCSCMKGNPVLYFDHTLLLVKCGCIPCYFQEFIHWWELINSKACGFNAIETPQHLYLVPVFDFCRMSFLNVEWFKLPSVSDTRLHDTQLPQLPLIQLGKLVISHPRWHVCWVLKVINH